MIANSANDPDHEAELISAFRQRRLDGLIIATANEGAPGLGDRVASFQASVLLDREVPGSRADAVLSDHGAGLREAIRHLAGLGHRRIALIAGTPGATREPRAHPDLRRRAREFCGSPRDPALCRAGEMTVEDGYRAVGGVLALADPPTAIIAGNNQLFAGFFAAIRDLGLRIPDDLSVVACEETELTVLHNPPLDVVRRDMDDLGRTAAELLLERLEAPRRRPRQVVLPTVFEPRGSSCASIVAEGEADMSADSTVTRGAPVGATAHGVDLGGGAAPFLPRPARALYRRGRGCDRACACSSCGDRLCSGAQGTGVGVVVESGGKMLVPVVRNAADASLPQVRDEVTRLVEAARTGVSASGDVGGAAVTVCESVPAAAAVDVDPPIGPILAVDRRESRLARAHAHCERRRRRPMTTQAGSSPRSFGFFSIPTGFWSEHDHRSPPFRPDRLGHGPVARLLYGPLWARGLLRPRGRTRLHREDHRRSRRPPAPGPPPRLRSAPRVARVQGASRRDEGPTVAGCGQRSRLLHHRRPRRRGRTAGDSRRHVPVASCRHDERAEQGRARHLHRGSRRERGRGRAGRAADDG